MLIGLSGFKGSGKDTVGRYLADHYGFEQRSFAGPLKQSAGALFDVDPMLWESLKNDEGSHIILRQNGTGVFAKITVREFLQRYGTEAHREVFGEEFWIEQAFKNLNWRQNNYVFTDVRFENEYAAISERDGNTIRIVRNVPQDNHPSEIEPDDFWIDAYIYNNATIADLFDRVDKVMSQFRIRKVEPQILDSSAR